MKISQRVFELLRGHEIMTDGQTDEQTDRQMDKQGNYYRAPPTSSGGALKSVLTLSLNITLLPLSSKSSASQSSSSWGSKLYSGIKWCLSLSNLY